MDLESKPNIRFRSRLTVTSVVFDVEGVEPIPDTATLRMFRPDSAEVIFYDGTLRYLKAYGPRVLARGDSATARGDARWAGAAIAQAPAWLREVAARLTSDAAVADRLRDVSGW